ncbi:hypothetical protein AKG11_11470 [Shinella sp. SUS2]|uniref:hypothetical protein n=1 Tax=unclassified Shinella TaxID=2643062 RepID=UPI000682F3C5|nr:MULTISPECIES: hypothetical protein [unclassified Shinella]KNY16933.1 hypothetical protein AKG11_11470 [Shinella sp. SUS2]KOC73858.1 hypothetical protein AKG10_19920 [Shinella sp. GWS1]
MTADDLNAWLEHMKFNDAEATRRLGLGSRNTLAKYKVEGAPLHIGLACGALAFGLPPWKTVGERDKAATDGYVTSSVAGMAGRSK